MENCASCGKSEEEVRLFDALYINESVKMCERCALIAGVPLIKAPSADQLKNSEKPYGVRERLSRIAGISKGIRKEESVEEQLRKIDETPELVKPDELVFKLINNFHWVIMTSRRRKCLSQRQLAEAIGESEAAVKLLETGKIPGNSMNLITKLEQFFNIGLIKRDSLEKIRKMQIKQKIQQEEQEREEKEKRIRGIQEEVERRKKEGEKKLEKKVFLERPEENPLGIGMHIKNIDELKQEEGDEMIKEAIVHEKPEVRKFEEIEGRPLPRLEFKRREIEKVRISDLRRMNELVEKDFEYEKHTKEEVGKEQLDGFGKEDMEKINRTIARDIPKKENKNKVPTIYDLMKKKEERDKSILGKDIEVEE